MKRFEISVDSLFEFIEWIHLICKIYDVIYEETLHPFDNPNNLLILWLVNL